jgi:hypothetical protein
LRIIQIGNDFTDSEHSNDFENTQEFE